MDQSAGTETQRWQALLQRLEELSAQADAPPGLREWMDERRAYWQGPTTSQDKYVVTCRHLWRDYAAVAQALNCPSNLRGPAPRAAAPQTPRAVRDAEAPPSGPPPAPAAGNAVATGLAIWKEAFTGCLAILIVAATLGVAAIVVLAAPVNERMSAARDVLVLLNGLVGVVLGYYFGRAPGDAHAREAEQQARASQAELDTRLAEVRELLPSGGAAAERGAADVTLSAAAIERLRELTRIPDPRWGR